MYVQPREQKCFMCCQYGKRKTYCVHVMRRKVRGFMVRVRHCIYVVLFSTDQLTIQHFWESVRSGWLLSTVDVVFAQFPHSQIISPYLFNKHMFFLQSNCLQKSLTANVLFHVLFSFLQQFWH